MKLTILQEKPIENIIFDFGGVILDIDISLAVKAFNRLGVDNIRQADIHPETKSFFLDLEVGAISDDQFLEEIRKIYPKAREVSDEKMWSAWNEILLEFTKERFELIKELNKHYNVYLLSNTNHPHRVFWCEKFEKEFGEPFESYFKKCYYSDELGCRKPDAIIYQKVLEDAGIEAEKSLFIDDNMINFSGATEVGLNWYHLDLTKGATILDIFEKHQ
ncbi:MAG: HAD family phosphatase [Rikenellaceae bacterium]